MTGAPERIANVSMTVFSTARTFGGCRLNGHNYTYDPDTDTLIRDDVLKAEERAAIHKKRYERMRKAVEQEASQRLISCNDMIDELPGNGGGVW